MKKYLNMAIENGDDKSFELILSHYINNITNEQCDDHFITFISVKNEEYQKKIPPIFKTLKYLCDNKLDLMELHFKYSLEGKGFEDAKQDFYDNLKNTPSDQLK